MSVQSIRSTTGRQHERFDSLHGTTRSVLGSERNHTKHSSTAFFRFLFQSARTLHIQTALCGSLDDPRRKVFISTRPGVMLEGTKRVTYALMFMSFINAQTDSSVDHRCTRAWSFSSRNNNKTFFFFTVTAVSDNEDVYIIFSKKNRECGTIQAWIVALIAFLLSPCFTRLLVPSDESISSLLIVKLEKYSWNILLMCSILYMTCTDVFTWHELVFHLNVFSSLVLQLRHAKRKWNLYCFSHVPASDLWSAGFIAGGCYQHHSCP